MISSTPFTSEEWEKSLQNHYLRTDGPYGSTPLTTLDATPSELRFAAGLDEYSDEEVIKAFLSVFTRDSVHRVFSGTVSSGGGFYAFRHFHYLVLSCLVEATIIGVSDHHNFRVRLGELLNDGLGPQGNVSGINDLWKALAYHLNAQASLGEAYRTVELPVPRYRTHIGYAVELAYPSRKDLTCLKKILQSLQNKAFNSRGSLINHLFETRHDLPARMQDELLSLRRSYLAGDSIEQYALWRQIESVLDVVARAEPSRKALLWQISLSFGGWDGDEAIITLSYGNRRVELESPQWEGDFAELFSKRYLPASLRQLIDSGVLVLYENRGGHWSQDDRRIPENSQVIVLSHISEITQNFDGPITIHDGWKASEPMLLEVALEITSYKGVLPSKQQNVSEFRIEEGLPLMRGVWLARPGYQPVIRIPEKADVDIQPPLAYERCGGSVWIKDSACAEGQWRITLSQPSGTASTLDMKLKSNAPRATQWARRLANYEPAIELRDNGNGSFIDGALPATAGIYPNRLSDALEALYARVGGTRPEKEIVGLIQRAMPDEFKKHLVWDLLRSLQEAGWLELDLNRKWRGRAWRVLPPMIVQTSQNSAIVEGALGASELSCLQAEAKRLSVEVHINAERPWAPPVFGLVGEALNPLAEALGWETENALQPNINKAPACWPQEKREGFGYKSIATWKSDPGLFVRQECQQKGKIALDRKVHEKDRDLFVIKDGENTFKTTQRVVALMEYARLKKTSLFIRDRNMLVRNGCGGHLPLNVAIWLRRLTGVQTGLDLTRGKQTYLYGGTDAAIEIIQRAFGMAIQSPANTSASLAVMQLSAQRRRGLRPNYYQ